MNAVISILGIILGTTGLEETLTTRPVCLDKKDPM